MIELLVVTGIILILSVIATVTFRTFQKEAKLDNAAGAVVNILRIAQNKTLTSEGDSRYGVYFDTSLSPHRYILFKGNTYASREIAFDKIYSLPSTVEIFQINLPVGSEIVFNRLTGTTDQPGSISLGITTETDKTKVVYVESSGQIGLTAFSAPGDVARIKDSRHLHFDYLRAISTATEKLILTFTYDSSSIVEEIVIANYLEGGQFFWQGQINVGGEMQTLTIHTHRLNNPDTQFCLHRDRRSNNRALTVTISDDASGTLAEYSGDGLTTSFNSIYVSNFNWQ